MIVAKTFVIRIKRFPVHIPDKLFYHDLLPLSVFSAAVSAALSVFQLLFSCSACYSAAFSCFSVCSFFLTRLVYRMPERKWSSLRRHFSGWKRLRTQYAGKARVLNIFRTLTMVISDRRAVLKPGQSVPSRCRLWPCFPPRLPAGGGVPSSDEGEPRFARLF